MIGELNLHGGGSVRESLLEKAAFKLRYKGQKGPISPGHGQRKWLSRKELEREEWDKENRK